MCVGVVRVVGGAVGVGVFGDVVRGVGVIGVVGVGGGYVVGSVFVIDVVVYVGSGGNGVAVHVRDVGVALVLFVVVWLVVMLLLMIFIVLVWCVLVWLVPPWFPLISLF